jgi:hypothetical protein
MNANPNPDISENNRLRPRRGPSSQGRQIINMRDAGAKQIVIAARIGVSVGAVKQCLRRHRRRANIRTPEDTNAPFATESQTLDLHIQS